MDDDLTVQNMYALDSYKEYAIRCMFGLRPVIIHRMQRPRMQTPFRSSRAIIWGTFNSTETDMTANLSRDCGYEKIELVPAMETSMYQSTMWSIPSTCENPRRPFQFNYLLCRQRFANMLTNGLRASAMWVEEQGERPGQQ